jgi:drug/metabolite transporter (DMT)-like permease
MFIINTSPVFCVLMDRFVLKEALPVRTIVMVLLGLAGVLIILLDDILFSEAAVVRKTPLFMHLKTLVLPRQARDKHRMES